MNILLIEDENLAAEKTIQLLSKIDPSFEVVHVCQSVKGSVAWLATHPQPDLIISDIQLLDGISFTIFKEQGVTCPVIFLTAYDQYAIQAFEVNSIAYLLKPVEQQPLEKAINKYFQLKENFGTPARGEEEEKVDYEKVMKMIMSKVADYKSRFLVKVGQNIKAVSVEKIAYFFTRDKLTYLVTHEGRKFPLDQSLEEISHNLDPHAFFRLNRKFIANIASVAEVHPYFKGRYVVVLSPDAGEEVVISAEKSSSFKDWLDK